MEKLKGHNNDLYMFCNSVQKIALNNQIWWIAKLNYGLVPGEA